MTAKPFFKSKYILYVSGLLALMLFWLKWFQLRFIVIDYAFEMYVLGVAALFTGVGGWMALKLAKPNVKTVVLEKEVYLEKPVTASINTKEIERLNLSNRELEILQLMAQGLTNPEIAEQLFLSINTIKTHTSRIFEKLDVNRRTQAVNKAKKLQILQ